MVCFGSARTEHFDDLIENAWEGEFKGAAADRLLETLATYLTAARDTSGHANCSVIVNSLGTGKFCVVDELSKRIITVPMCLRGDGSEGSPLRFLSLEPYLYKPGFPRDSDLRQWLLSGQRDQRAIKRKLHGFIFSVLAITQKHLEGFEDNMFSEMTCNRCRIYANL